MSLEKDNIIKKLASFMSYEMVLELSICFWINMFSVLEGDVGQGEDYMSLIISYEDILVALKICTQGSELEQWNVSKILDLWKLSVPGNIYVSA